jgi:hypothetical protein
MTSSIPADTLRERYLAALQDATQGLPQSVAAEIRDGIAEELQGLDTVELTQRIAQLGDPLAIAREAQAETMDVRMPDVAAEPASSALKPPATTTRGFAIAAALTLSFGGFVLPFAGWIVGAVLVSLSSLWKTGEKVIAIVIPFVLFALSAFVGGTLWGLTGSSSGSSSGSSTGESVVEVASNPLVPAWYDLLWSGAMVFGVLFIPLSGLWLLWRLRGRGAR